MESNDNYYEYYDYQGEQDQHQPQNQTQDQTQYDYAEGGGYENYGKERKRFEGFLKI